MNKKELLYEGKAKQVYQTDNPDEVIIHFKDDATAFNAQKKGEIKDKGVFNNNITSLIYTYLESQGIKTHFIEKLNDREQLCQKVNIFPLEFVTRNIVAGSMAQRLGLEEGYKPNIVVFDICYKKDELGDPLINDYHAVVLGAATFEELDTMYEVTGKINRILIDLFDEMNLILVDFKIEFGKNKKGEILLADEITPDTCRLWDKDTMEKMDKDRFRRDLGNVEEAYAEILKRVSSKL